MIESRNAAFDGLTARTLVVPAAFAVINPLELTVAMSGSSLVQVADVMGSTEFAAFRKSTVGVNTSFTEARFVDACTITTVVGSFVTVIVAGEDSADEGIDAVIVALPVPTAVTRPVPSTVATPVADDTQLNVCPFT